MKNYAFLGYSHLLEAWVKEVPPAEEVAEVLALGNPRLSAALYRRVPAHLLPQERFLAVLDAQEETRYLTSSFSSLCSNPTLSPEQVERILELCRTRMQNSTPEDALVRADAAPWAVHALEVLEAAGHRVPEDFMQPVLARLQQSEPGTPNRSTLGAYLILEGTLYNERSAPLVYEAAGGLTSVLELLLRDPRTPLPLLRRILRERGSTPQVLEGVLGREEALRDPLCRSEFIRQGNVKVLSVMLEEADEEEVPEILLRGYRIAGAWALQEVERRVRTPEAMLHLIRFANARFLQFGYQLFSTYGETGRVCLLEAEDVMPYLTNVSQEVRLRSQLLWSNIQARKAGGTSAGAPESARAAEPARRGRAP